MASCLEVFLDKTQYAPFLPLICVIRPACPILYDLITLVIFGDSGFHKVCHYAAPCYLFHFRPKYIPHHPIPVFLLSMRDKVSHPYKTTDKIIVVCVLIIIFFFLWVASRKAKDSDRNGSRHFPSSACFYFLNECNFICKGCSQIFCHSVKVFKHHPWNALLMPHFICFSEVVFYLKFKVLI